MLMYDFHKADRAFSDIAFASIQVHRLNILRNFTQLLNFSQLLNFDFVWDNFDLIMKILVPQMVIVIYNRFNTLLIKIHETGDFSL